MKVYFPAAILDREDFHPLDAETCRVVFTSRYPRRALDENDFDNHEKIIEIDVPEDRLKAVEEAEGDHYKDILRKQAVKSHIGFMSDVEIYEVLDAAGIEYEIPSMAPGF